MDTKFKEIMSSGNAFNIASGQQEMMYLSVEDFLIQYIAQSVKQTAAEGFKSCRITLNIPAIPSALKAGKVAEHFVSPLFQLGYKFKVLNDKTLSITWGFGEEKDEYVEPF